ncbi:S-adenosyl-L-methionine-dependent methyltransferase [Sporodiniella umbellata]|nr:S-adenosyl-L-methionine-dependent methyltransferase [Sporodiniella umbellata]
MFRLHRRSTFALQQVRLFTTFQEGDFCMLRQVRSNKKLFAGPLLPGGERGTKEGVILHDSIIGKPPRSLFKVNGGVYMAHFPTLNEYVVNVPRQCTPIYPKDACSIVEMLDLEPGHNVLEAGTGNGSLTLHLARAVAGGGDTMGKVDTFDVRSEHSRTAQRHVQKFSRGRYQPVVSFHVGSVGDTLETLKEPGEYYDGIALDMPEPTEQIPKILPYLKNDRFIVCYLPNMTQVIALSQFLDHLPLVLEDCLEVDWKEWEVRSTHIRSKLKEDEAATLADTKAWICRPINFDVKGHTAFLVKLRKIAPVP